MRHDQQDRPRARFSHARASSEDIPDLERRKSTPNIERTARRSGTATDGLMTGSMPLTGMGIRDIKMPVSIRLCAALASTWFAIRILTLYPALFLMFCYPVLLAAVLEPMKVSIWKCMWWLTHQIASLVHRSVKEMWAGKKNAKDDPSYKLGVLTVRVQDSKDTPSSAGLQYSEVPCDVEDGRDLMNVTTGMDSDLEAGNRTCTDFHALEIAMEYAEEIWKKVLLLISIMLCLMTAGRIVIILGKIVFYTAEKIASDFPHYQRGAKQRIQYLQDWIASMTEARLGKRIDVPVSILIVSEQQLLDYAQRLAMSTSTYMLQQVVPQACITTLFLVFLMWNPVRAEGSRKEVLELCSEYVKIKSALSTLLGFLVGSSLMMCGLELYYAAGMLVAVANFVPNGALLCSTFPCLFGLLDDRKLIKQVVAALIIQITLINGFAFIIEPLFFGAAIEMHPIPAILGVTFFGYVWGLPGMLISIPLLGAFRLVLAAWAKRAAPEERPGIEALQGFIEGRWTAAAELGLDDEDDFDRQHSHDMSSEVADPSASHVSKPLQSRSGNSRSSLPDGNFTFPQKLLDLSSWCRSKYHERAVLIDGLLYLGLVYFLFSSWSDRVFGVYGEPPAATFLQHNDRVNITAAPNITAQ